MPPPPPPFPNLFTYLLNAHELLHHTEVPPGAGKACLVTAQEP